MESFIKFISSDVRPYNEAWLSNPDNAFNALSLSQQINFLLEQAVALNYISRVFNGTLPLLIKAYKDHMEASWVTNVEYRVNTLSEEDQNSHLLIAGYTGITALLNQDSSYIDYDEIIRVFDSFSPDDTYQAPVAVIPLFYKPYLRFVANARKSAVLAEGEHAQNTESFTVPGPVSFPQFAYRGNRVHMSYELQFSSFKYNYKENHDYGTSQYGLGVDSIFSFWRCFDWREMTFNSVVGVLASQCLELDTNIYPNKSLLWAYNYIYRTVTGWTPRIKTESYQLWLSSESNFLKQCVIRFLVELRKRYGMKFDDSELLSKLLGNDSKDDDDNKLHAFLTAEQPSEVSVEMYNAFQKSVFAKFHELDLFKVKRLTSRELMDEQLSNKSFDELDESDDPDAQQDDSSEEETALSDQAFDDLDNETEEPDDDDAEPAQTDTKQRLSNRAFDDLDSESFADDGDTAPANDEDAESVSDNADDAEDQDADGADDNPDDEPTTDELDGLDEDQQNTHTQETEPEIETNDKTGVKLELSTGETADSVLYRMELEAYIDSLLVNPPISLSAQKVELLKRIKAYWINLLKIDALANLVKSITELPKHLNLK